jgi:DHA2 family multidrug resistance protein
MFRVEGLVVALQILLVKCQEEDWFGSTFIVTLAVISIVCFISLVVWEWRQQSPVVDVRMFRNVSFAVSSLMLFALGVLLFTSLVMMPLFLHGRVRWPGSFWREHNYPV